MLLKIETRASAYEIKLRIPKGRRSKCVECVDQVSVANWSLPLLKSVKKNRPRHTSNADRLLVNHIGDIYVSCVYACDAFNWPYSGKRMYTIITKTPSPEFFGFAEIQNGPWLLGRQKFLETSSHIYLKRENYSILNNYGQPNATSHATARIHVWTSTARKQKPITIAMLRFISLDDINVPTRGLLAVQTHLFYGWDIWMSKVTLVKSKHRYSWFTIHNPFCQVSTAGDWLSTHYLSCIYHKNHNQGKVM